MTLICSNYLPILRLHSYSWHRPFNFFLYRTEKDEPCFQLHFTISLRLSDLLQPLTEFVVHHIKIKWCILLNGFTFQIRILRMTGPGVQNILFCLSHWPQMLFVLLHSYHLQGGQHRWCRLHSSLFHGGRHDHLYRRTLLQLVVLHGEAGHHLYWVGRFRLYCAEGWSRFYSPCIVLRACHGCSSASPL